MKNFFLKSTSEKNNYFKELRDSYAEWKDQVFKMNKPFFPIHSDFQDLFLKDISGPALKLYVFLGLNSRYHTGESWFSSKEISDFFRKDQRTVQNWFQELEDLGLISREQKGFKMKANSFLRPYGFTLEEIKMNQNSTLEHVVNDMKASLELNRELQFGLLLNYALKEFTFIVISQKDQVFYCSCFLDFEEIDARIIREALKKYNVSFDNFDIDTAINVSRNKQMTIYNHILKYLREESN
ncbi:helix-turn-helix domain-containing protein [Paenibacillus sp. NPDC093718]|uniref:helix-turn-helix domain-containing protein n=1 Tax=Paenibacillus sp. NPDC093718 TaxID=3390601 RepID=UPI003CFBDC4E